MNDIYMDRGALRAKAEELYAERRDTFMPEVERIKSVLLDGIESDARRGSATQTLGAPGELWSGTDFGASHDEKSAQAVALLEGLVGGYLAFAYSAAGAAEGLGETDGDAAQNIQRNGEVE